jgi:hypothetical protein
MLANRDHPANKHPVAPAPAQAPVAGLNKEIHPFPAKQRKNQ